MTSTAIYHYVYRITNLVEKKHYYGKRSSKIEPKLDLGFKYFSSSTDKEFMLDQKVNPQNYKYKVVFVLDSAVNAINRECTLHTLFNVSLNKHFYNKVKQNKNGFDPTGKIITKDIYDNYHNVNLDDPRYLSGELVVWSKNKVYLKDKNNNKFYTTKDDPRYLSGELVSVIKNMVCVKDIDGNAFRIHIDDPRYLSGELVHVGFNKEKTSGINNINFNGYYITPHGKFASRIEAGGSAISRYCKNSNVIITKLIYI